MDTPVALLLTDLVDSAGLAQRLGDAEMVRLWTAHDRLARDLLRLWRGREIDKTDGFLLLFDQADDALGYALAYHQALTGLSPHLRARVGLHVGLLTLRETPKADVALGAKPFEADGVSKPIAARVMSAALGGQTLVTRAAMAALGSLAHRSVSHGHWLVKGLPEPIELFEVGAEGAPFTPPPDTEKVYRVVRSDDIWLPAREVRHNLPAERDAFVGRRTSLQDLARRFDDGARLVSVLGIGGAGKTRLATRYGWTWLGDHPGGVWFCDLAPARSVEGLCSAVAQALGVPLGTEDPVAQLGHALAGQGRCLVILDNFEQIARHAEATLGRWLERAGLARFLVTTREVLGIAGEEALALAPLPAAEGEALFLRRAQAARHGFQASGDDLAAVGPLVRLLDGLPLAIELAAARVRTLDPGALLARMSERFKLLASSGGRQDRQATLRAAFDWSWELLTPAEKMALAQLSVFEGGFTLSAAEGVIDLEVLPDRPWTLDVLHSLVDKSFVRRLSADRFDLLVSVQAYGDEHLRQPGRYPGSGPLALHMAQARHADWFARLGPARACEHGGRDLDNLVAACQRAALRGDTPCAAGALEGAWAALSLRGPFHTGVALAQAVQALPADTPATSAQVQAVLGSALAATGQQAAAVLAFEAALVQARLAQDTAREAATLCELAALQARQGQFEPAVAGLVQALALARSDGDADRQCQALNGLGTLKIRRGQTALALEWLQAALALAEQAGLRRWQSRVLSNLGGLHADLGQLERAQGMVEAALRANRELGDRKSEGTTMTTLAMLHQLQGQPAEAARVGEAAALLARQLGHTRMASVALCNLGLAHGSMDQWPEAARQLQAALDLATEGGDERTQGQVLGYLGQARARLGDLAQARQALTLGQQKLESLRDFNSLALLLCCRGEAEHLAGERALALACRARAAEEATASAVGPASELGRALARLDSLLQRGPSGPSEPLSR